MIHKDSQVLRSQLINYLIVLERYPNLGVTRWQHREEENTFQCTYNVLELNDDGVDQTIKV